MMGTVTLFMSHAAWKIPTVEETRSSYDFLINKTQGATHVSESDLEKSM